MLVSKDKSCLLIVDMQEKLFPKMLNQKEILKNINILIESANTLTIPILFSEQYPKGLGSIIPEVQVLKNISVVEKTTFSCGESEEFIKILKSLNRSQVIIAGVEAHVCVLQTAIDLKNMNYHCFVVEDAISSRVKNSKDIAKKRLGDNGCDLVSTEMVLFEWIKDSSDPNFKKFSKLVV